MNDHPSEELSEYLLEFQAAYTKNAHKRRKTIVSLSNPRHSRMLNDIWEAAHIEHVEVVGARKWKKIGFSVSVRWWCTTS
jgi:engulfment/cell motility protein 1